MEKRLPTFLFVGAAKCGSTWIYKALQAHPEVYVPAAKDIYFFDAYYDNGLDWYASFFSDADGTAKALGELSHDYLYSRQASERIKHDLPRVKLLACLRNPIERALSVYHFRKRNGTAEVDFESTVNKYPQILERGQYFNHLKVYLDCFGDRRFRIFLFDDLGTNALEFSKSIYDFVGVDAAFEYLDAQKKVLPASQARLAWLAVLGKKAATKLRHQGHATTVGRVKDSFVFNLLYKPIPDEEKETLSPVQRRRLIEYYAADIGKLEALLQRDLRHWLQ